MPCVVALVNFWSPLDTITQADKVVLLSAAPACDLAVSCTCGPLAHVSCTCPRTCGLGALVPLLHICKHVQALAQVFFMRLPTCFATIVYGLLLAAWLESVFALSSSHNLWVCLFSSYCRLLLSNILEHHGVLLIYIVCTSHLSPCHLTLSFLTPLSLSFPPVPNL